MQYKIILNKNLLLYDLFKLISFPHLPMIGYFEYFCFNLHNSLCLWLFFFSVLICVCDCLWFNKNHKQSRFQVHIVDEISRKHNNSISKNKIHNIVENLPCAIVQNCICLFSKYKIIMYFYCNTKLFVIKTFILEPLWTIISLHWSFSLNILFCSFIHFFMQFNNK